MLNAIDLNDNWIFSKVNHPLYESELITEGESVTLPHCWNSNDGQGGSEEYFRGTCW
jgi:beta-galactosidase